MINNKLHFQTRLCTIVIYPQDKNTDPELELKERVLDKNYKPPQKEFNADFEKEEILGIIEEIQREERMMVDRRMEAGGIGMGQRRLR